MEKSASSLRAREPVRAAETPEGRGGAAAEVFEPLKAWAELFAIAPETDESYETAIEEHRAYLEAMDMQPRAPLYRAPIRRPPRKPRPPRRPRRPNAEVVDWLYAEADRLYAEADRLHAEAYRLYAEADRLHAEAYLEYQRDLEERVRALFSSSACHEDRLSGPDRDEALVVAKIDDALRMARRGKLPAFALEWTREREDTQHAAERYSALFELVEMARAEQRKAGRKENKSVAYRRAHELAKPRGLLAFGEHGKELSVEGIRKAYQREATKLSPNRRAKMLNHGAALALWHDLLAAAGISGLRAFHLQRTR